MSSHEREINTSRGVFVLDAKRDAKMAGKLAHEDFPQQDVLDLVEALGATRVVDVGAHVGTVSVPLARQGKAVVAFEPDPASFGYLLRNAARNRVLLDARNKGLGAQLGRACVVVTESANAGAHSLAAGSAVEVSTLDQEVYNADFIKIDVEGMELEVLKGGTSLIVRSRPAIYFEVHLSALHSHRTSLTALARFFAELRYELYVAEQTAFYHTSLYVAALLTAPRAFLFGGPSAPFDLLALPREARLPCRRYGVFRATLHLLQRYTARQLKRLASMWREPF